MTIIDLPAIRTSVTEWLATHDLAAGVGNAEHACSIAALNLAITGRVTDAQHECISPVVRTWVIQIQDAMPDRLRNAPEWKRLVPLIAGSAYEGPTEAERLDILLNHMWRTLATLQAGADERGFGKEWATMCAERSEVSAAWAARAAEAAGAAGAAWAAGAAEAAWAAGAAEAAEAAGAAWAAGAAEAAWAARAAEAAEAAYWAECNPAGVLAELLGVQP